jgi:hypothetical protein
LLAGVMVPVVPRNQIASPGQPVKRTGGARAKLFLFTVQITMGANLVKVASDHGTSLFPDRCEDATGVPETMRLFFSFTKKSTCPTPVQVLASAGPHCRRSHCKMPSAFSSTGCSVTSRPVFINRRTLESRRPFSSLNLQQPPHLPPPPPPPPAPSSGILHPPLSCLPLSHHWQPLLLSLSLPRSRPQACWRHASRLPHIQMPASHQ